MTKEQKKIFNKFKRTPYDKAKGVETLEETKDRLGKRGNLLMSRGFKLGLEWQNKDLGFVHEIDRIVDGATAEANGAPIS